MKLGKKELQRTLNSLARAQSEAMKFRAKISDHCQLVYGCDPADVDFDQFIDACDGGCGHSSGMTVEDFEKGMEERIKCK